ncbi:MAG: [FeFe] hydrogenase H-cluster maturation GTPase HydF [Treponema sp.]|jgi:[FeFe] hydrogenase H-cluster maturation GTPase HydF|nr:[FeFe] hydrogenase H-cluster maturation GTPase HydF [Treponema sp.]
MESTPRGLRRHIALFGKTNSGKSMLFNLLTGCDNAIVSEKAGTTTDPVLKNMELLPFGPVTLIDTAGLDDTTELGKKRIKKTRDVSRRADIGLMLADVNEINNANINGVDYKDIFSGKKIDVFTKCDLINSQDLKNIKEQFPNAVFVSQDDPQSIELLKNTLVQTLKEIEVSDEDSLICSLVPRGGTVVMAVSIDSEAPKGRLILPQVQLIRDCLDHGVKVCVTRETELKETLAVVSAVDLVVADSQIFNIVNNIVPANIPLTSFSILLAHQKGNFKQLLKGIDQIKNLKNNDPILILEACTHNHTHEDIGRVKIPALLEKYTGKKFNFHFFSGYNINENPNEYSMAILCGSCMINKAELQTRLKLLSENNIPVTNYGIILAFLNGILERCTGIFTGANNFDRTAL